ncbi:MULTISPECIES: porin family protein [Asticcacaulis]|uniref:porin family protein n=1 Tax=Asticcacaulis TaxID=76890 RepID=UPI001AE45590|nr:MULTISPECIES: porin family protein [Asticcacaulis]MBP2159827.1 hypothetical protein [Asticcacaulis solisilvae]MDR6800872.1 hypothetical protein [Asticcacaulis sp. BE141]
MLKIAAISAVALVAAFAGAAQAQDAGKYYVEGGYANIQFQDESFGAANFGAGIKFNKYLGAEANASFGISEQSYVEQGVTVDVKVDNVVAAYLVASYPVSANVELLGRVGFLRGELSGKASGVKVSFDDDAFAAGVGVRYFPNGGVHGVRADFTRAEFEESDVDQLSISYVRRF